MEEKERRSVAYKKEDFTQVATVWRAKGLDGTLLAHKTKVLWSGCNEVFFWQYYQYVPYQVLKWQLTQNDEVLLNLKGINSLTLAHPFKGAHIFVMKELVEETWLDSSFLEKIKGYRACTSEEQCLAHIDQAYLHGNSLGLVLASERITLHTFFKPDQIIKVDEDAQRVYLYFPDSLSNSLS